ncbi:hypothetical protein F6R98_10700 [Candidatus Methylospira mobilis]|uniref:Uncharacterized protein n=1 Tax=Candidatus Methylospira mobilis TaxID=1808979 RepID=A0A5Q0BLP7_9GAMM|nr:hypothetical protein [Candidatus Methylospira mobilis]QFY43027.1 hypothetical protein F6R98_10700 [Candidatus Methylospira mobilis]
MIHITKKTITYSLFILYSVLYGYSLSASATTLEELASVISLPENADYSANDWSSTDGVSGVKWKQKGIQSNPSGSFTRTGKTTLDKLGPAIVTYIGPRTMIFAIHVDIDKPMVSDEYKTILSSQFKKSTTIHTIRDNCKDEGPSSSSGVYEAILTGKKPVYILVESSSGASGMDGTTGFDISLASEDRWKCSP